MPELSPGSPSDTLDTLRPRFVGWAETLHDRGWDGFAGLLIDLAEPLAPLGAGVLYVVQPTFRLFGTGAAVGDLARVLETPGGIDWLRQTLDLETD